ncbi:MAG: flippase-like domain-containing protein [Anaerolineae bacterium]|nr:flippase-like domain-containing protein [Anaerolineae bacterium]
MKRRKYWSIVVLVLVVAAIVWYLRSQPYLLAAFRNVSLLAIIYLVGMRLLFLGVNGLFLREFAAKFEVELTSKEWFGLSVVTTMGNYITPFSGGMIARAAYLKHRHEFPYAQFATLLASNYLVTFWVIGVVGALALLTFGKAMWTYWQLFVFFMAVVISISALILFPAVRLPWENRIAKALNTSLAGWKQVKNDRVLLAKLVAYTLVNISLNALCLWVAYDALGSPVPFRSVLLVGLLTSFSLLIGITPGNLGIQEAVVSLSSGLLGIGTGQGLLAALLIRGATIVPTFILGPIFGFLLTRKLAVSQGAEPSVSGDEHLR